MKSHLLLAAVIGASLGLPLTTAQAQGIPGGAAHGAYVGSQAAGPVGAVVGGAVGGFIGGVQGLFGIAPAYASYPEGGPVYYHHHRRDHWTRHTYRHPRRHATS